MANDTIGTLSIPQLQPVNSFPLDVEFGFTTVINPLTVTHLTGPLSGDLKREQTFYLGPGIKQYQIDLNLSEPDYITLRNFYEIQSGPTIPFFFSAPLPGGGIDPVMARFASEPLVAPAQPGFYRRVSIHLNEFIDTFPGPFRPIAKTLTRFPDTDLNLALANRVQTIIPLLHIRPRLSTYPDNLYFSDRRITVGPNSYLPRLLPGKWSGVGQVGVGLPGVSPEADDVQFVLGNADRAMRQLADDVQLDLAVVEFSLYHVETQTLIQLWVGEIVPGGWQANSGPEFTIRCSDPISSPFMVAPPRVIDRLCDKLFNDSVECPFSTASTGLDTIHYPTVDPTFCDHGYTTPNGCKALGMERYYNGVIATPQEARIKDNTTGFFGFGRTTFTSVALIADSAYGLAIPIVVTDIDYPVNCIIIAGRDEGDFYEAMAVVCRGPVSFTSPHQDSNGLALGSQLDGQFGFGYPRSGIGTRNIVGADPAQPGDFVSLDLVGDQTNGDPNKIFSGGLTFDDNFSAGVAFTIVRRTDAKGLQLSTLDQHTMQTYLQTGWLGWKWTSDGMGGFTRNSGPSNYVITNPVWFAVNLYLLCKKLFADNVPVANQEAVLDLPAIVAAADICDLVVPRIVETSQPDETQWKCIGTLKDQRALRDWLNDILTNCLGYFTFTYGKLSIGVRENASDITAYTDGNVIFRSVAVSPLGPQYTKLVASFADREYNFVANSASFQDNDYAAELGGGVQPNHRKADINLSFTADISPATRNVITRGREEIGGVNAAERKVARRVTFKTTILGLDTSPGAVISLTNTEIPNGVGKFRVERWKLNPDWSIDITARTVTDSMYDLVLGPKPADVQPADIPPTVYPAPYAQKVHPDIETPDPLDPLFDISDRNFGLRQEFTLNQDGSTGVNLVVSTRLSVNTFIPNTPSPVIKRVTGLNAPGGQLTEGTTYIFAVAAYDNSFEPLRRYTPNSNLLKIQIPIGSGFNAVQIDGIVWPSGAFAGYSLFAAEEIEARICEQFSIDGLPLPTTILLSQSVKLSTFNLPSNSIAYVQARADKLIHAGPIGITVSAVDSTSITTSGLAGLTDDWSGRDLSVIADASDGSAPLLNFHCSTYDPATGKFTVTPDPALAGVEPDDVLIICYSPDSITATTIGDAKSINGIYPAGDTIDRNGNVIIAWQKKTGNRQIRKIVSNTPTVYTVDRDFDPIPDSTWTFIVASGTWAFSANTGLYQNAITGTTVDIPINAANIPSQQYLVKLVGIDVRGGETAEEIAAMRIVFLLGSLSQAVPFTLAREHYSYLTLYYQETDDKKITQVRVLSLAIDETDPGFQVILSMDMTSDVITVTPFIGSNSNSRFGSQFHAGMYLLANNPLKFQPPNGFPLYSYEIVKLREILPNGDWVIERSPTGALPGEAQFGSKKNLHINVVFFPLALDLRTFPRESWTDLIGTADPNNAALRQRWEWAYSNKCVSVVLLQASGGFGLSPIYRQNLAIVTAAGDRLADPPPPPGLRTLNGNQYDLAISGPIAVGMNADYPIRLAGWESLRFVIAELMVPGNGDLEVLLVYVSPNLLDCGVAMHIFIAAGSSLPFYKHGPQGEDMPLNKANGIDATQLPAAPVGQQAWPPYILPRLAGIDPVTGLPSGTALSNGRPTAPFAYDYGHSVVIEEHGRWDLLVVQSGGGAADLSVGVRT